MHLQGRIASGVGYDRGHLAGTADVSWEILRAAWEVELSPSDKLVLLSLADHAKNGNGQCWPSVARIVRRTGLSDRQVQRSTSSLASVGLISIIRRAGRSNTYVVHPRPVVTGDVTSPVTQRRVSGDKLAPHPRPRVTQTIKNPKKPFDLEHRTDLSLEQKAELCELIGEPSQARVLRQRAQLERDSAGSP